MIRALLVALLACLCANTFAQNGFLILKKRNKNIRTYFKDNRITFRMQSGEWITGTIDKIQDSSFNFTQEIIRFYTIGIDTFRIYGYRFNINEIDALPSKRQQYVYRNDQVVMQLGKERFVWVKNGFLFQAAGGSYLVENIVNDLYRHEPPFTSDKLGGLGIAAGFFLLGTAMHMMYDPTIKLGKKFKLVFVSY